VRKAALLLGVVVTIGTTACGPTLPHLSGSHTTKAPTPPNEPPATTTTLTEADAPRCSDSKLRLTIATVDHGTGQERALVLFQNVGSSACNIEGYPGVAGLAASGAQVEQATRIPDPTQPSLVTLASGEVASAAVYTDENQIGTEPCVSVPTLLVTPPNLIHSVRLTVVSNGSPEALYACQPLGVGPVSPGSNGGLPALLPAPG
jgi:hypothetical protein